MSVEKTEDLQVFGITKEGGAITSSMSLEELLKACQTSLPVSAVYALIPGAGGFNTRLIGNLAVQLVPVEEVQLKEAPPPPEEKKKRSSKKSK